MEFTKKELKTYSMEVIKESELSNTEKIEMLNYLKESDEFQIMEFLNKGQFLKEDIKIDEDRQKTIKDLFDNNYDLHEILGVVCEKDEKYFDEMIETFDPILNEVVSGKMGSSWGTKYIGGIAQKSKNLGIEGSAAINSKKVGVLVGGQVPTGVGAAMLAMAIIAAGWKIYTSFISKIGKACKNFSGPEAKKCKLKFKITALEKASSKISSLKSKCSKSKDPKACQEKINNKLAKYKEQINGLKSKLSEVK